MTEEAQNSNAPTSIIGEDGNFVKNWQTLLKDESLHEDKTLGTIKNPESLAKSYVHVRKQVPLDKIAKPTENYGDEDWNQWYEAGGRPPTAADYNIQKPEEFPEEHWNKELMTNAQEVFHKIGLNQKQAKELMSWYNQTSLSAIQAEAQNNETQVREVEDALHREWGAAFSEKVRIGNLAVEKAVTDKNGRVDEEYKIRLLDKINRDPDLIKMTSNLGGKFIEAGAPMPGIPTPGDIQNRINEEMAKPAYCTAAHPDHKRQVQLVQRLFQEKQDSK